MSTTLIVSIVVVVVAVTVVAVGAYLYLSRKTTPSTPTSTTTAPSNTLPPGAGFTETPVPTLAPGQTTTSSPSTSTTTQSPTPSGQITPTTSPAPTTTLYPWQTPTPSTTPFSTTTPGPTTTPAPPPTVNPDPFPATGPPEDPLIRFPSSFYDPTDKGSPVGHEITNLFNYTSPTGYYYSQYTQFNEPNIITMKWNEAIQPNYLWLTVVADADLTGSPAYSGPYGPHEPQLVELYYDEALTSKVQSWTVSTGWNSSKVGNPRAFQYTTPDPVTTLTLLLKSRDGFSVRLKNVAIGGTRGLIAATTMLTDQLYKIKALNRFIYCSDNELSIGPTSRWDNSLYNNVKLSDAGNNTYYISSYEAGVLLGSSGISYLSAECGVIYSTLTNISDATKWNFHPVPGKTGVYNIVANLSTCKKYLEAVGNCEDDNVFAVETFRPQFDTQDMIVSKSNLENYGWSLTEGIYEIILEAGREGCGNYLTSNECVAVLSTPSSAVNQLWVIVNTEGGNYIAKYQEDSTCRYLGSKSCTDNTLILTTRLQATKWRFFGSERLNMIAVDRVGCPQFLTAASCGNDSLLFTTHDMGDPKTRFTFIPKQLPMIDLREPHPSAVKAEITTVSVFTNTGLETIPDIQYIFDDNITTYYEYPQTETLGLRISFPGVYTFDSLVLTVDDINQPIQLHVGSSTSALISKDFDDNYFSVQKTIRIYFPQNTSSVSTNQLDIFFVHKEQRRVRIKELQLWGIPSINPPFLFPEGLYHIISRRLCSEVYLTNDSCALSLQTESNDNNTQKWSLTFAGYAGFSLTSYNSVTCQYLNVNNTSPCLGLNNATPTNWKFRPVTGKENVYYITTEGVGICGGFLTASSCGNTTLTTSPVLSPLSEFIVTPTIPVIIGATITEGYYFFTVSTRPAECGTILTSSSVGQHFELGGGSSSDNITFLVMKTEDTDNSYYLFRDDTLIHAAEATSFFDNFAMEWKPYSGSSSQKWRFVSIANTALFNIVCVEPQIFLSARVPCGDRSLEFKVADQQTGYQRFTMTLQAPLRSPNPQAGEMRITNVTTFQDTPTEPGHELIRLYDKNDSLENYYQQTAGGNVFRFFFDGRYLMDRIALTFYGDPQYNSDQITVIDFYTNQTITSFNFQEYNFDHETRNLFLPSYTSDRILVQLSNSFNNPVRIPEIRFFGTPALNPAIALDNSWEGEFVITASGRSGCGNILTQAGCNAVLVNTDDLSGNQHWHWTSSSYGFGSVKMVTRNNDGSCLYLTAGACGDNTVTFSSTDTSRQAWLFHKVSGQTDTYNISVVDRGGNCGKLLGVTACGSNNLIMYDTDDLSGKQWFKFTKFTDYTSAQITSGIYRITIPTRTTCGNKLVYDENEFLRVESSGNDEWYIFPLGDGTYYVTGTIHQNYSIYKQPSSNIMLRPAEGEEASRWLFVPQQNSTYNIISVEKSMDRFLSVQDCSGNNNVTMTTFDTGSGLERFSLELLQATSPPPLTTLAPVPSSAPEPTPAGLTEIIPLTAIDPQFMSVYNNATVGNSIDNSLSTVWGPQEYFHNKYKTDFTFNASYIIKGIAFYNDISKPAQCPISITVYRDTQYTEPIVGFIPDPDISPNTVMFPSDVLADHISVLYRGTSNVNIEVPETHFLIDSNSTSAPTTTTFPPYEAFPNEITITSAFDPKGTATTNITGYELTEAYDRYASSFWDPSINGAYATFTFDQKYDIYQLYYFFYGDDIHDPASIEVYGPDATSLLQTIDTSFYAPSPNVPVSFSLDVLSGNSITLKFNSRSGFQCWIPGVVFSGSPSQNPTPTPAPNSQATEANIYTLSAPMGPDDSANLYDNDPTTYYSFANNALIFSFDGRYSWDRVEITFYGGKYNPNSLNIPNINGVNGGSHDLQNPRPSPGSTQSFYFTGTSNTVHIQFSGNDIRLKEIKFWGVLQPAPTLSLVHLNSGLYTITSAGTDQCVKSIVSIDQYCGPSMQEDPARNKWQITEVGDNVYRIIASNPSAGCGYMKLNGRACVPAPDVIAYDEAEPNSSDQWVFTTSGTPGAYRIIAYGVPDGCSRYLTVTSCFPNVSVHSDIVEGQSGFENIVQSFYITPA